MLIFIFIFIYFFKIQFSPSPKTLLLFPSSPRPKTLFFSRLPLDLSPSHRFWRLSLALGLGLAHCPHPRARFSPLPSLLRLARCLVLALASSILRQSLALAHWFVLAFALDLAARPCPSLTGKPSPSISLTGKPSPSISQFVLVHGLKILLCNTVLEPLLAFSMIFRLRALI